MTDPRGPSIPFRIDPHTGRVAWADGEAKIREDVILLLGTRKGERPMLRDYGSTIAALVHEPDDDVTADLLRRQAQEVIIQWEPRIFVTRAQVDRSGDELRLAVDYVHSNMPVTGQMIVPLT